MKLRQFDGLKLVLMLNVSLRVLPQCKPPARRTRKPFSI